MSDSQSLIFRAVSDPTRRAIFEHLCTAGEASVGTLTAHAGVSQPAVSKHLAILKSAGLATARHDGRSTIYTANPEALRPLTDWTAQMATFWAAQFDALDDLLRRMDQ